MEVCMWEKDKKLLDIQFVLPSIMIKTEFCLGQDRNASPLRLNLWRSTRCICESLLQIKPNDSQIRLGAHAKIHEKGGKFSRDIFLSESQRITVTWHFQAKQCTFPGIVTLSCKDLNWKKHSEEKDKTIFLNMIQKIPLDCHNVTQDL